MLILKLLALVVHWEDVILSKSRKCEDSVLANIRQKNFIFLIQAQNERGIALVLEQARNGNLKFTLVSHTETRIRSIY